MANARAAGQRKINFNFLCACASNVKIFARSVQVMYSIFKKFIPDAVIIIALILAAFKYVYALSDLMDIALFDETTYLARGVMLARDGFPSAEAAPLYALWYFLLSLAQPDRVQLYYLNAALLTLLLPLALYIALRCYRVSIPVAALAAFLLLIAQVNLSVTPRVNHFALLVLLIALACASLTASLSKRFSIIALGMLLASYARPELYYAFILAVLVSIVLAWRERKRAAWVWVFVPVLFAIVLERFLGLPLSGTQRAWIAFGQHFALNWASWNKVPVSDAWGDWKNILQENFGDARTLQEIARANPAQFSRHIFTNIATLPANLFSALAIHANLILPFGWRVQEAWVLLALVAIALLARYKSIRAQIRTHRAVLLLIGFICLVPFAITLVIHPRLHYLILLSAFLFFALALLLDMQHPIRNSARVAIAIGIALVLLTPNARNLLDAQAQPTLNTIRFLQSAHPESTMRLLSAERGYETYVPDTRTIAANKKKTNFDAFLRARKINAVLWNDRLANVKRFRNDAEWKKFIADPGAYGYKTITGPDGTRLLIASSLFPN